AFDFPRGAVEQRGGVRRAGALPACLLGKEPRARGRRVDAGRLVVAHGGTMNEDIELSRCEALRQALLQLCEGAISFERPALPGGFLATEHGDEFGMRAEKRYRMATLVAMQSNGRTRVAGKNVRDAAHPVDGNNRVAGCNEDVHEDAPLPQDARSLLLKYTVRSVAGAAA